MNKILHAFFLLALIAAAPAIADEAVITGTTLEVSAQASINAPPDMATVSSGVITDAPTADAAMQENAKKMTAVFTAIKAAGIAEKDLQTSGITLNPQYNYSSQGNEQPKITGYQASNTVSVVLRDLKNVGPVFDALVSQGANQLNGPIFGIDNQDEFLDKARVEAVKKARQRAEIYATAAGMSVRRIISISENAGYSPPVYPMMKAMAMDGARTETPVAAGEVGMNVTVNVKFELAP